MTGPWGSMASDAPGQFTPNHGQETPNSLTLLVVETMAVVWDQWTLLFALPTHRWPDSGGWLAFSRSENSGNSALGLLRVWSGCKGWWDMSCGEDPKVAQTRGRVCRVLSLPLLLLWQLFKKVSLILDSRAVCMSGFMTCSLLLLSAYRPFPEGSLLQHLLMVQLV